MLSTVSEDLRDKHGEVVGVGPLSGVDFVGLLDTGVVLLDFGIAFC